MLSADQLPPQSYFMRALIACVNDNASDISLNLPSADTCVNVRAVGKVHVAARNLLAGYRSIT